METIVAGLITGWITLLMLAMSWMVKGRLDAVDVRLDEFGARLDEFGARLGRVEGNVGELGTAVGGLQSEVENIRAEHGAELRALRSDVTQIAIALGTRGRPETG